jgi:hypothetical protein
MLDKYTQTHKESWKYMNNIKVQDLTCKNQQQIVHPLLSFGYL